MAPSCCTYESPSQSEMDHMKKCWHLEIPGILVANPVVFASSCCFIWAFVIAICVEPDYMGKAMSVAAWGWIPECWTWLYIVSQDLWVMVLLWAMCKHGSLKLGNDDEEPEFSTATWFSMLFCAGVATGLFYYSVAEPIWHFVSGGSGIWGQRFHSDVKGYGNEDENATHALMVTVYHWGIHGWIPYSLMGAVISIMTYRRGFPMTIRYCFYPLVGDAVYGWMGDFVDGLSIVTTIAGVCTSLGLGAMQINTGMQRIDHGFYRGINFAIPPDAKYDDPTCGGSGQVCADGMEAYGIQSNIGTQILIIIVITSLATFSVVLGLGAGIKFLSQFVFALGNFLVLVVLFSGETYYVLDAIVQVTGYYFWYILRIGFYCDAFERLGDKSLGLGGATDGKGGGDYWLIGWTIFYWGWWISWGPFCGTFLAKISRGRTLRQFILATLVVPTLYAIFWFGVWGGEGIRMQRVAAGGNLCSTDATSANCSVPVGMEGTARVSSSCTSFAGAFSEDMKRDLGMGWTPSCVLDPAYHGGFGRCQESMWTRMVPVGDECVEHRSWVELPCGGGADPTEGSVPTTGPCIGEITDDMVEEGIPGSNLQRFNLFPSAGQPDCFVPLQDGTVCLGNRGTADMLFDIISAYGPRGFSDLLSCIALACLVLYFVTSSDSGSLVVDILSANGHPDPPMFQRIFWSFTEGATAVALLYSGVNSPNAKASLEALQAASICCGLPYTFIIFWCAQSLILLCMEEAGDLDVDRKAFNVFIFNLKLLPNHLLNTAAPGFVLGRTVAVCGGWPGAGCGQTACRLGWTAVFMGLYWAAIFALLCGHTTNLGSHALFDGLHNWSIVALVLYIGFGVLTGLARNGVRTRFQILHGDLVTDLVCGLFAPMFTISQMAEQMANDTPEAKDTPETPRKTPRGGLALETPRISI